MNAREDGKQIMVCVKSPPPFLLIIINKHLNIK